ncbi:MAG TPA: hypothetical protein VGB45_12310, partial [Abditibacterium sp.]
MNTQRFIWAATTLLFAVAGAMLGYSLGRLYVTWPVVVTANSANQQLVPLTLSIGFFIVMARLGSALADKLLVPGLKRLHTLSAADRVLGVVGALSGLTFGVLVTLPIPNSAVWLPIKFCIMAVSAALGMALFGGMRSEMLRVFPQLEDEIVPQFGGATPKFLDTNVIIDGRLGDICKTGFIEGPIYVPQ